MVEKSSELNSRLFNELSNKITTVLSNRSLVADNQQLRVQLAFAKSDVTRLQNEIVELQRRIGELEAASDEKRIELIVRKRLQQRVQHLKSITTRTMQYMKKATADFDNAANRLDHIFNYEDDTTFVGESMKLQSAVETEDDLVERRSQKSPALEVVEEDVFGEMAQEERDGTATNLSYDARPINPMSEDVFKRFFRAPNSVHKTTHRNSRRETFYIKKEPVDEFAPSVATVPVVTVSESSECKTYATPKMASTKCNWPRKEITPRGSKSTAVLLNRKKKINDDTPNSTSTARSASSISIFSTMSPTENWKRPRRAAAARINSLKEPSLSKKMRNPNVN